MIDTKFLIFGKESLRILCSSFQKKCYNIIKVCVY